MDAYGQKVSKLIIEGYQELGKRFCIIGDYYYLIG